MQLSEIRNCNLDRVYRINSTGDVSDPFVAGTNAAGEQILMGVLDKELLVAIFFSPDGRFRRTEFFPVPWNPNPTLLPGQQENQHGLALQDAKRKWMAELGMRPGDICIRHFAFPEWQIGIAEWPLADFPRVQQALAAGQPLEDEFLIDWQQQKRWVLIWKKEYWMTAEGEIGDT
jgi:hypothetical protein